MEHRQNSEDRFGEPMHGQSNMSNEGKDKDDLEEAYSKTLDIKRTRRLPSRFKDFQMNFMVMTPDIDLSKLSKV